MGSLFSFLLLIVFHISYSSGCNEAICASLVSKCILIGACDCDITNAINDVDSCPCCHRCQKCLSALYNECCSCVGLCEHDYTANAHHGSSFDVIFPSIPDLFELLTKERDEHGRWTSYSCPAHRDIYRLHPNAPAYQEADGATAKANDIKSADPLDDLSDLDPSWRLEDMTTNCTVAFLSDCVRKNSCYKTCKSMGASRYRWFHQSGCCQCVGSDCLHYGISEPRCTRCQGHPVEEEPFIEEQEVDGAVNRMERQRGL